MSLGYRVFVVADGAIVKISHKTFDDFYSHKRCALPQYANQPIHVVMVVYTLENRKPNEIIRIDSMRFRVMPDGSIDEEHQWEIISLSMEKADGGFRKKSTPSPSDSTVFDAEGKFKERKWKLNHPDLSRAVIKTIYESVLG